MRLHEEYIFRKNLDIPVILYEKRSNVFLRSKEDPYQWMIFNISWVDGRNAPGMFCISASNPKHNGYEENVFFSYVYAEKMVQWDDYSDFIVDYAKNIKKNWSVVSDKERNLALWQMFLQVYDGWIVKNTSHEFYQLVEESIRLDNDFHKRFTAFRNARTRLEYCDEEIYHLFKYEIFPLVKGHSNWLEKLINGC